MKNVLILIHDDAGQEARFQAGLDIARALRGHLKFVDVTAMVAAPFEPAGFDAGAMLIAHERQREADNKARLQRRLAHEDVSWDWVDVTGWIEPSIEEAATLADLIVVNARIEDEPFPDMLRVASALIVDSGKPVLVVPPEARDFRVAGTALLAWDGSREAQAALAAAVPLLGLAEDVVVVQVDDGSIREPAEAAASYLSRHGIAARVIHADADGGPAATVLLAKANSGEYDWLVMGGFGHARIVEAMFGGVTRRMLKESPIPLFIAR